MALPTTNPHPYRPQTQQPQPSSTDQNLPSHAATQPKRSRSSDFVPRLMLMLVMLFLTLSLIAFIAWAVIDPKDPAVRLKSLSISNINISNSQFKATYDIEFSVNNTNKKVNMLIDHVKIDVLYKKNIISKRVLDVNVDVRKMSQGSLKAELGRDLVRSVKDGVFKDLSDEWSKKMVTFDVNMRIRIRFGLGIWPSKQRFLVVSCMNLPVEFVSVKGTGKLMSGGKDCLVQVLNSIY